MFGASSELASVKEFGFKGLRPARHKNRTFWRRSSHSRSLLGQYPTTEKHYNSKQHRNKMTKHTNRKTKSKQNLNKSNSQFKSCSYVHFTVHNCRIQSTVQNTSDNLPSYLPDSHHSSGVVYWSLEGRGTCFSNVTVKYAAVLFRRDMMKLRSLFKTSRLATVQYMAFRLEMVISVFQ